jgi:hypothetical protein
MASIGLSATRMVVWAKSYEAEVGSIAEGAVVIHSTADDDKVKLPAAAGAPKVAGVCMSAGGPAIGERIEVQKAGQAVVLLAAGLSCVRGDELIVANSSGHVKVRAAETACVIVGRAEVAHTSGAAAEFIPCTLTLNYLP